MKMNKIMTVEPKMPPELATTYDGVVLTEEEIGRRIHHFSPSQLKKIFTCKFKWAADYLYKFPADFRPGQNLKMGSFLHNEVEEAAIARNKDRLTRDGVLSRMIENVPETKSFSKEKYGDVVDIFLNTYCKYYNFIYREDTEVKVEGRVAGICPPMVGYIDHIYTDAKGRSRIIDLKIKSKLTKRHKVVVYDDGEYIQQGLYAYFSGIRHTELFIIQLKKNCKTTVEIHNPRFYYTDEELVKVLCRAEQGTREMYSGVYLPNRSSDWCRYDMCGWYNRCHRIWS